MGIHFSTQYFYGDFEMNMLQAFTEQQLIFITEYAKTENMSAACTAAGINRGTGYNWIAKQDYKQAVEDIRRQMLSKAWGALSARLQLAVDTVVEVLQSDTATNNTKLRAAELIINQTRILTEEQELLARLDRLEAFVE